jgi:hypothetical protein
VLTTTSIILYGQSTIISAYVLPTFHLIGQNSTHGETCNMADVEMTDAAAVSAPKVKVEGGEAKKRFEVKKVRLRMQQELL